MLSFNCLEYIVHINYNIFIFVWEKIESCDMTFLCIYIHCRKKPIVINFAFLWGNICWPKCIFIDILSFNSEFCMNIHLHLWALFMYIYPLQKDLFLCLIRGSICWLISIVPLIASFCMNILALLLGITYSRTGIWRTSLIYLH